MVPAEIERANPRPPARQLERLAGDQLLRHREDAAGAQHRNALRARLALMLGIGRDDLSALLGAVVAGIVDGHEGNVAGHGNSSSSPRQSGERWRGEAATERGQRRRLMEE